MRWVEFLQHVHGGPRVLRKREQFRTTCFEYLKTQRTVSQGVSGNRWCASDRYGGVSSVRVAEQTSLDPPIPFGKNSTIALIFPPIGLIMFIQFLLKK